MVPPRAEKGKTWRHALHCSRPSRPLGAGALEGLYEAHAPELRRRCMRLTRDGHAADDLMQEVFVRFITRFPEPPSGMNVGAYLHATARNVLWKQLRDSHEVSDGDIETTVGADDDLENDPERSALLGEQQGLVRRCAAVLTGRQRRALTMRDVEGRSYGEIGSELGIGTGAVMQVISRARARLRVAVRRANVDLDNLAPECVAMLGPLSDYLDGRAAADEQRRRGAPRHVRRPAVRRSRPTRRRDRGCAGTCRSCRSAASSPASTASSDR